MGTVLPREKKVEWKDLVKQISAAPETQRMELTWVVTWRQSSMPVGGGIEGRGVMSVVGGGADVGGYVAPV